MNERGLIRKNSRWHQDRIVTCTRKKWQLVKYQPESIQSRDKMVLMFMVGTKWEVRKLRHALMDKLCNFEPH
jgi:hypothetical protein